MKIPRILVVDDEATIRQSYRTILEETDDLGSIDKAASALFDEEDDLVSGSEIEVILGNDEHFVIVEEELPSGKYEIVEAAQGEEAVELVRQSLNEKRPFSMMFLDVRMPPGIDGVEAASQIRELDPFIEIVIMTAYSDYNLEEVIDKVGNPNRLLYFHKPFNSEQIQKLASSLTQHWYLEKKRREQDGSDD